MRKTFLLGLLAIALFAGSGLLLTWWLTRDDPVSLRQLRVDAEPPPALEAPPPSLPDRRPLPAPAAQGSLASLQESARLAKEMNAPADSSRGSKAYRPPRSRREPRGATNGLLAGLGALQPRVANCGNGTAAPPTSGRASDQAVLVLDLEPMEGQVKVVGARVHSKGTLDDQAVDCARGVLVGQVITVAQARPGQHMSFPYPLRF